MTSPATPTGTRARDPYWDNLRFVAMALVVVGHTVTNFIAAGSMTAVYVVLYAFHMPLFAFVSGYFAKAGPLTPATAFGTVRQLIAPYVVFMLVWFGLRMVVEGGGRLDFGSPYTLMWFLLALAVWRTVLPYLVGLRYPVAISVLLSVGAGYLHSTGSTYESGKVLGMLPFFVLGWAARDRQWARPSVMARLTSVPARIGAVVLLLAALLLSWTHVDALRQVDGRRWVRMAANYAALDTPEWWAGLIRLGLLGAAVVLGASVMALTPRRTSAMTAWGTRTMYVYMLHLIPLYLLERTTSALTWFDSFPRLLLAMAAALLWAAVLSTEPVQRVFRPVVEPRLEWLRARSTVEAVAPAVPVPVAASAPGARR